MTRVGVIIPDRGDRPEFLHNCINMLEKQTLFPSAFRIVGDPPKDDKCDITFRYRTGYSFFEPGMVDVIAFIENDDFYAPDYLATMAKEWEKAGRPDLFGTLNTAYYHLKLRKFFNFRHVQRSMAMSTMIKPGLKLNWPRDEDPYTDAWLWDHNQSGIHNKAVFEPSKIICVAMKHNIGKTGGEFHNNFEQRFINDDKDMYWLEGLMDSETAAFYKTVSEKLNA